MLPPITLFIVLTSIVLISSTYATVIKRLGLSAGQDADRTSHRRASSDDSVSEASERQPSAAATTMGGSGSAEAEGRTTAAAKPPAADIAGRPKHAQGVSDAGLDHEADAISGGGKRRSGSGHATARPASSIDEDVMEVQLSILQPLHAHSRARDGSSDDDSDGDLASGTVAAALSGHSGGGHSSRMASTRHSSSALQSLGSNGHDGGVPDDSEDLASTPAPYSPPPSTAGDASPAPVASNACARHALTLSTSSSLLGGQASTLSSHERAKLLSDAEGVQVDASAAVSSTVAVAGAAGATGHDHSRVGSGDSTRDASPASSTLSTPRKIGIPGLGKLIRRPGLVAAAAAAGPRIHDAVDNLGHLAHSAAQSIDAFAMHALVRPRGSSKEDEAALKMQAPSP